MVIDHADRLHEGVADGRADKAEAARFQVLAQRVGLRRARRDVLALALVLQRLAADEGPNIPVERAEFLLYREERAGVGDGAVDFQPIAQMPSSFINSFFRAAVKRATFFGSKPAKASR